MSIPCGCVLTTMKTALPCCKTDGLFKQQHRCAEHAGRTLGQSEPDSTHSQQEQECQRHRKAPYASHKGKP